MTDVWMALEAEGFSKHLEVKGYPSIAHMFPNKRKRCGIYVLHFTNGECYVGQSVDVVKRYSQHRKRHTDIERLSFMLIPRDALTPKEIAVIRTLSDIGLPLRNINIVDFSYAHTDFETVMPLDEQLRWRDNPSYIDAAGDRPEDLRQRSLYAENFKLLSLRPMADEIIHVAAQYVHWCIPAYQRSELSFWSCTARPKGPIYVRINTGWQTVFDAGISGDKPWYKFYLTEDQAISALGWSYLGASFNSLVRIPGTPRMRLEFSELKAGGINQTPVVISTSRQCLKRLETEKFVLSVRAFNLGLIQKSPCMWSRNHCFDLADRLVEPQLPYNEA